MTRSVFRILTAVSTSALAFSFVLFIGCSDDGDGSSPVSPPEMGTLSDSLSGTLDPGSYHIVGDILIGLGDTLRLMPGTTFQFDSAYSFATFGILLAEGIGDDPIVFTMDTVGNPNRWYGLLFLYSGSSGSRLDYCLIENGSIGVTCPFSSPSFTNCTVTGNSGCGVFCHEAYPIITNCTISKNSGGGVYCEKSSPTFTNCTINGNSSSSYGGGVHCSQGSAVFTNCTICENTAEIEGGGSCGVGTYLNCSITGNSVTGRDGRGGGAAAGGTYINCTISGNTAIGDFANGGGVCPGGIFEYCMISDNFSAYTGGGVQGGSYTHCIITGNSAVYGGGVFQTTGPFTNCIISHNTAAHGGGVYGVSNTSAFINCTIIGNSASSYGGGVCNYCATLILNSTIIAFSEGEGVYFDRDTDSQLLHCNLFGNSGGALQGVIPAGLGDIVTTNSNDDSCDVFLNIFLDPMFVDREAGNFHLTEESPCINAGDPDLPRDPDRTIADIGAFYYPLTVSNGATTDRR